MSRYIQGKGRKGSLRDIQVLINSYPSLLNSELFRSGIPRSLEIKWKSPLRQDNYTEYRDGDFLKLLGLNTRQSALRNFWPRGGPQWDGLGVGERAGKSEAFFLVEAKANIPELVSGPSHASKRSLPAIEKSLKKTKRYLEIDDRYSWNSAFYQYANRLAHLYFLRELKKINTYLIFVYFIGDKSVAGPQSIQEWEAAISMVKSSLGIKRHRLLRYVVDIFIPVMSMGLTGYSRISKPKATRFSP